MLNNIAQRIKQIFTTAEIRDKILFSVLVLVLLRLLATIPSLGVNVEVLQSVVNSNQLGETLNFLSGGLIQQASIIALGIGPYINASIILQLLTPVIPYLEELKKEGNEGRRKVNMYTRLLTLPLAIFQAFTIYILLSQPTGLFEPVMGDLSRPELLVLISIWTAGAMLVMWLSERITENGLGNGASFIIVLGIIAFIPSTFIQNLSTADTVQTITFIAIIAALVAVVILFNEAERRIPVLYSRRVRSAGPQQSSSQDSYIPIKILQFGVMPVIFSLALVTFPQIISQLLINLDFNERVTDYSTKVLDWSLDPLIYNIASFVMVLAFSFFYVSIMFKPEEIAENLQKQGGFLPGIRPGKQTEEHLRNVAYKMTFIGGFFLGFLTVLPNLLLATNIVQSSIFSSTSVLIIVSVLLEMYRQVNSMIVVRDYDKYI